MPCQTKPPTGEKAAPRYVAPTFVPTATNQTQRFIQSQLQAIQANLQALNSSAAPAPQTLPLQATGGTVQAREGDTVRVAPGATGVVVLLPTARAANKGKDVTVLVEGPGTVTVRAVDSQVQGVAEVTLSGAGLRVFRSDGGDGQELGGWWIVGQSSANASNQLVAISAGTNFASTGTVVFSNSNSVSFGMNTAGVVTAQYAYMPSVFFDLTVSGPLGRMLLPVGLKMFDTIAFTLTGDATLDGFQMSDGSEPPDGLIIYVVLRDQSGGSAPGWQLQINDHDAGSVGGSYFRTPGQIQGTTPGPAYIMRSEEEGITCVYKRGVSNRWSIVGGTAAQQITGPIEVIAGNGGVRTASFNSNAASNGLTVAGSSQIQWLGNAFSAGAAAPARGTGTWVFSDANNVSFGRAGSTITASVTVASTQASIRISAGTTSALSSSFRFSDLNNVTFGMSTNGVITASVTVASTQASINLSAGTTSNLASAFTFANLNGLSFGLNAGTITGSYTVPVVPAQTSLVFSNSNNVTFGIAGSTLTASVTVASTADPQIGLVSHIGGNSVSSVTRLAFSNASNVTWSLSTAANAATVLASVAAGGGGGITAVNLSAGTTSQNLTNFVLSDSNNVSFGLSGSTVTATAQDLRLGLVAVPGTNAFSVTRFALLNTPTVTWNLFTTLADAALAEISIASSLTAINVSAGTTSNNLSAFTLSDANNVSFGLNGSVVTASASDLRLGLVSGIGAGGTAGSVTRIAFSSAPNIVWSVSSAAGAATVLATVGFGITAGTTSNVQTAFQFANANNVSFGLNGTVVTASASVASTQASIRLSAGTTSVLSSAFTFSDANNVSFGINNGTITATATVASSLTNIRVSAGTTSNLLSALTFSQGTDASAAATAVSNNNVAFGINASTITAKAFIRFEAGNASTTLNGFNVTGFKFINSNGLTWGTQLTTDAGQGQFMVMTASHNGLSNLLVSEVGGNSVSAVSRIAWGNALVHGTAANAATVGVDRAALSIPALAAGTQTATTGTIAFLNSNGVTFGMSGSTAITASVAAGGGGGGIAFADDAVTNTSGTILAHSGINVSSLFSAGIGGNSTRNVQLGLAGGTNLTGQAHIRAHHSTNGAGEMLTRINFLASNGVTFGVQSAQSAAGAQRVDVTASVDTSNPPMRYYRNWVGFGGGAENQSFSNGSASVLFLSPLGGGRAFPCPMTANTLELLFQGHSATSTQSQGSYGFTIRGGLYTLVNSTQLGLVNSFSTGFSTTTQNSSTRNDLVMRNRWYTVGTGNWSSSPVFSQGVQYWIGLHMSTAGLDIVSRWLINRVAEISPFAGQFNVAQSAQQSSGYGPFWGWVSSNGPPANISTGQMQSSGLTQLFGGIPTFQMRDNVARA